MALARTPNEAPLPPKKVSIRGGDSIGKGSRATLEGAVREHGGAGGEHERAVKEQG